MIFNSVWRFSTRTVMRIRDFVKNRHLHHQPFTLISIAAIGIPVATTIFCSTSESSKQKEAPQLNLPEQAELSLKKMIQHSSFKTVDAALQMILLTTAAIMDTSKKYRDCLTKEMKVLNYSLELANMEQVQGDLNDLLIVLRDDVKQADSELQDFVLLMQFVEKLVDAAAEVSFLSEAEHHSFSLSSVIHESKKQVTEQLEKNKELESQLRELQRQIIVKTEEKAASNVSDVPSSESDSSGEEATIPDPVDKQGEHIMFNNF